jgi:hypothetical protein
MAHSRPSPPHKGFPKAAVQFPFEVRNEDVLLGRGRGNERHPGNQYYLSLLQAYQESYNSTESRNEKTRIVNKVIDTVTQRGGRFIKFDHQACEYVEADSAMMHVKTSHALRYQPRRSEGVNTKPPKKPEGSKSQTSKESSIGLPVARQPQPAPAEQDTAATESSARLPQPSSDDTRAPARLPTHSDNDPNQKELLSDKEIMTAIGYDPQTYLAEINRALAAGGELPKADSGWKNEMEMSLELQELFFTDSQSSAGSLSNDDDSSVDDDDDGDFKPRAC